MKVIAGKYKGRNLVGYNLEGTRPTMERVKESLFAMIQTKIMNSTILDLFSGSGNLAIEALSQGASYAYLVDNNIQAVKTMEKNTQTIGIKNCQIIKMDYSKALKYLSENNIQLDIIFLDPPYKTNYLENSIKQIEKYQLLKANGIIICESDTQDKIVYSSRYTPIKEKKYGDKWIVILKEI